MSGATIGMIFHSGLLMSSLDSYLHIISLELLAMLVPIVVPLLDNKAHKSTLSTLFLTVQRFMLAHFATYLLPDKIAGFIYILHHEYRSIKTTEPIRT